MKLLEEVAEMIVVWACLFSKKLISIALLLLGGVLLQVTAVHAEAGLTAPQILQAKSAVKLRTSVSHRAQLPSVSSPIEFGNQKLSEGARPESEAGGQQIPVSSDRQPEVEETSPLELSVAAADREGAKSEPPRKPAIGLVQFGYNFFRPAAGFSPLTDVPVNDDYPMGPGDRVIVTLWGSVDGTYELEVNRNGEIFLPRVGGVKIWGVPFGKLHGIIKANLTRAYKDFDLNVSMGRLRMMKVFVVGEVLAPGGYNLNPMSTLINALSAAGGPLKSGTLRNVQVTRNGKIVETVDLYDFFLKGNKNNDIRLQSGDTILVPVIGRVASVAGNVKRPAIYELRDESNLAELIGLAGGFLPTGYLQRVHLTRVEAHQKNMVADFNVDVKNTGVSLQQLLAAITIQDMDIVKVFPIDTTLRGHVRLDGYALRPGDYALQPGMRLSNLIRQDNLLPEFYVEAVRITRLFPPDFHPETFYVNLSKALAGDPAHDLELKEFDTVKIFSRWEMEEMPKVKINGEVQRPGQYRLSSNLAVRDLIMEAGNLKISAYLKQAEISRYNRTGVSVSTDQITINLEEALKGNPKDNLTLQPMDELTIRKIPNWAEETERYISLKGEFQFPGVYPIFKGDTLDKVIKRAGGYTERAYLRGAKFTRQSIKELQQKRMREVLVRSEQEIVKKQSDLAAVAASKEELEATRAALEGLKRNIELLKSVEAEGRLVISLQAGDAFTASKDNVVVQGGDILDVPQTPSSVNVLGQVYNPTSLIPVDNQDVAYYLSKSGGTTKDADNDSIYVIKTDGSVVSRQQSSFINNLFASGFMSGKMEPGDTIVVPQQFEKIAWLRDIKDISTILGQIALTAGVLIAAGL